MGSASFATPILKLTERCNFSCSFCRYAMRDAAQATMPAVIMEKAIREAAEYNVAHDVDEAHVVFHGGEPLLAGLELFEEAMSVEDDFCAAHQGFSIANSVQTNGSLMDARWRGFFKDRDFSVGISIDGPSILNAHYRVEGHREESNRHVLANLAAAHAEGLPAAILSVITDSHAGRAREYYRFLVENDIHDVGLCFCFGDDDVARADPEALAVFLVEMFDAYFFGEYPLHIREFDRAIERIVGAKRLICAACNRQMCGNYPTVYPDGSVYFCDSLCDRVDYFLGNLSEHGLAELLSSERWNELKGQALEGAATCRECEWETVCGSGCFRHDCTSPDGTGTRTYFCGVFKTLYPHIHDAVASIGDNREGTGR